MSTHSQHSFSIITVLYWFFYLSPSLCGIKVLYTAAILDKHYQMRKEEYMHSLKTLQAFGYEPYIVESASQGSTFFDKHAQHVCYTKNSNPHLRNKGVNEAISMLRGLEQFNFDDTDIVVKISGRCYFTSDNFLRYIAQHPEIDAFVKYDPHGQVFTGCFALRAHYFKGLLRSINYTLMERGMINFEKIVAEYIKNQGARIQEITDIGVIAHYFGDGDIRVITYR